MGSAWRVACLSGWRGGEICFLHRVWLARVLRAGLPRLYCDLRCLYAKQQDTNSDTDAIAELWESGRPYHHCSGSIVSSMIRHRLSTATATRQCIEL